MTDPQLKMELIETLKYAERAERLISTIKAQTLITIIRQIAENSMEFEHCEHSVKFATLMVRTLGKIAVELEPSLAEVYDKFKGIIDAVEKQASELSDDNDGIGNLDPSSFIAVPPDWKEKPS